MRNAISFITPEELHAVLSSDRESALFDVREQEEFSREHLLLACCLPLSRLELQAERLAPCKNTEIYLMDGGTSEDMERAMRGACALRGMGYASVAVLAGGLRAWRQAGFVVVNGVGALSKGFGEYVEIVQGTPRLTPEEIKGLMEDPARPSVVIDVRPAVEYARMNIPGSVNLPGCEVTYRLADVVKDDKTTIIINCAGRTRSIIGTQTLINAGVPNRVVALKGGTMNWQLSGFELEYGSTRPVPALSEAARRIAEKRIRSVAEQYAVRFVEPQAVAQMRSESTQNTLYLFDVRMPSEFEAGHLPGSVSAQGGQLVQATDEYAAVRNGRFVLVDDDELRAIMTAHWLGQMGLPHVYVLRGGIAAAAPLLAPQGLEVGSGGGGIDEAPGGVAPEDASRLMRENPDSLCLNVGYSNLHRVRHIPRSVWLPRAWLPLARQRYAAPTRILITAEESAHAALAAKDARLLWPGVPVDFLQGGTPAWEAACLPLEKGMPQALCAEDDIWYRPYTDINASKKAMKNYFDWESGLVDNIKADGCVTFSVRRN